MSDPAAPTNRLAGETSLYLKQHAAQPGGLVPVGAGGARNGRRNCDRPIFLSVGYSACHWCHVMEHESFEDDGDRGRDERPLRLHQGGPRGAAGPRHRST